MFEKAIHLTGKDFEIKGNEVLVKHHLFDNVDGCVMIYAPWCPHCQIKDENISKMADYMNKNFPNYKIAVANGDSEDMSKIKDVLKLEGFPSFYHISCKDKGGNNVTNIVGKFDNEGYKLLSMFNM